MPHEEQEIRRIEEKLERLENRLRTTFQEVEKRFSDIKTQPIVMEDRLQELEDLILLMQLEITKIKERTSVTTEFLTPEGPSMSERLSRIEEAVGLRSIQPEDAGKSYASEEPEEQMLIDQEPDSIEPVGIKPEPSDRQQAAKKKDSVKLVSDEYAGEKISDEFVGAKISDDEYIGMPGEMPESPEERPSRSLREEVKKILEAS
jgi:hypothetical protein